MGIRGFLRGLHNGSGRGSYRTWGEAISAAGRYDDANLTAFRLARASVNRARGFAPDHSGEPLFQVVAELGRPLHVVDFGGATGELGEALARRFPGVSVTVVEHGQLLAGAPHIQGVTFVGEPPAACEVFHVMGTLQYLDRPYEVLERGFASASQAVVLSRNSFEGREVFRVQRSRLHWHGSGVVPAGFADRWITTPHRSLVEARVLGIAERQGFRLAKRTPETRGAFGSKAYGAALVFLRR